MQFLSIETPILHEIGNFTAADQLPNVSEAVAIRSLAHWFLFPKYLNCDLDVKLIVYCRSSFGLGLKRHAYAVVEIDGKDTCEKLVELIRR